MHGIVFDIKEFAVHDGPGIRTTVFLKGCPLRCAWCHNPEGLSPEPETLTGPAGTRVSGQHYDDWQLAEVLNAQVPILRDNGGGVTFSGGEPLMQAAFVAAVIARLEPVHVLLDTSGYGESDDFESLVDLVQLVYFDLKLMSAAEHRRYTGVDNGPILANLSRLRQHRTPVVIRVPLVPGVTDTQANLEAIADAVVGIDTVQRVDLLPYNRAAGGKYEACGTTFRPTWDETRPPNADAGPFRRRGIPVTTGP